MQTHIIIRPLAAALLAACALTVAACGGDDEAGGATPAADREKARDAMLAYARCMREHGVEMPDPSADGPQTFEVGPGSGVSERKYREADKACRKHMEDVKPPELSDEQRQEAREAALANARCMREHGIENFPDPTFGENGETRIQLDKGSGVDPHDPDFKAAIEACRKTLEDPGEQRAEP